MTYGFPEAQSRARLFIAQHIADCSADGHRTASAQAAVPTYLADLVDEEQRRAYRAQHHNVQQPKPPLLNLRRLTVTVVTTRKRYDSWKHTLLSRSGTALARYVVATY